MSVLTVVFAVIMCTTPSGFLTKNLATVHESDNFHDHCVIPARKGISGSADVESTSQK